MEGNHEGLDQFKKIDKVNTTPLLKDLQQYITPHYAADWDVMGTQLGLPIGMQRAIKAGNPTDTIWCCNEMWIHWLKEDTNASWKKVFRVIESPAVICRAPDKGTLLTSKFDQLAITEAEAVAVLSNRVSQINVTSRFIVDDNTWPPEQPKSFTPLLLIHHKGHRTLEEVTKMAELMHTGDIDKIALETGEQSTIKRAKLDNHEKLKISETSRATKEIAEILAPLENSTESTFVLIEGAPGIGKSVLLKEIAYRWGSKQLLKKYELVILVYLRDPSLQQVITVTDFLKLFCKRDENATQIASACAKYLFDNNGKTLALLLDGYDEYPKDLQKDSLIADILMRKVLPLCGLVVSSRPHASQNFHKCATIRVDILGFTETEREHYIKQALQDQPHKIKELTQYLYQRPSVDSICFIPFNMVVLLYLYKLGIPLPNNTTELYRHFIWSSICQHLLKHADTLPHGINNLTDLPEPYNKIIQQLSKLSLEAINNNRLIFTVDEITAACPDIATIPGAINGFGLLQAVQHFGLYTKAITLNFLHFTIQEYLAAHYICHLPPDEEFEVIAANFWSNIHFNMFSIYISLTKGQRSSFKKFLSSNNEEIAISSEFLKDQLKCLRLYRCFKEADDTRLCNTIEQADIFKNRQIDLMSTTLTGVDIECISLFLASSFNKVWEWLNLSGCYIQDKGLNLLYRGLRHATDITINALTLNRNGLTVQSSSLISELTVRLKVKVLGIAGNNTIGEDQQLYTMLSNPSSILETLDMQYTQLSSVAATDLFTSLRKNHKLKRLFIGNNFITDDACDAITTAIKSNSGLFELHLDANPLSSKAIVNITQCRDANNTSLHTIWVPVYP